MEALTNSNDMRKHSRIKREIQIQRTLGSVQENKTSKTCCDSAEKPANSSAPAETKISSVILYPQELLNNDDSLESGHAKLIW